MRAFVDKVEDGKAELRLGEKEEITLVLPLKELPHGTKEGDVLKLGFELAPNEEAAALDEQRRRLLERSKDEPF